MSSGICCSWCTAGCVPGVQRQPMFLGPRQVGRGMPDACSTCLSNCIWSEDRRMVFCYSFSSCWSSASTTTGQLSCSGWCTCQYYRRGCRLVGGTASNAPLNVTFVHSCTCAKVSMCQIAGLCTRHSVPGLFTIMCGECVLPNPDATFGGSIQSR